MKFCYLLAASLLGSLMMLFIISRGSPPDAFIDLHSTAARSPAAHNATFQVKVRRCGMADGTHSVQALSIPEVGYRWVECTALTHREIRPHQRSLLAGDPSSLCRVEAGACKRQRTEDPIDPQPAEDGAASHPMDIDSHIGTCSEYMPEYIRDPRLAPPSPTAARGDFKQFTSMPPAAEFSAAHTAARAEWSLLICREYVPADPVAADQLRALAVEAAQADAASQTPQLGTYSKDPGAGYRGATQPVAVIATCLATD